MTVNLSHLLSLPDAPRGLHIRQRIDSGGAGDVFLASDLTDQPLALKIVSPNWHERELESLRAFRRLPAHPALVQILQLGELSDGRLYYTMELADNAGESDYLPDTLELRIRNRTLPYRELLKTIRAAASAAGHLHRHGLFHGDIKPENIIYVNGEPKLADFGTLSAERSGTAGFRPDNPESGSDRDCYALGKTLYCAWSGLDAAAFPDPPERFDTGEWRKLRAIYLRACHPVRRRRFSSTDELIRALDCAAGRPLTHARHTLRRKLRLAGLIVVLLLALMPLFFFIRGFFQTRFPDADTRALLEPQERPDPVGKIVREAETWLNEHPDEVAQMEQFGLKITRDPEFGLEYYDPHNGVSGVGLTGLLEYWDCIDKTTGKFDGKKLFRRPILRNGDRTGNSDPFSHD